MVISHLPSLEETSWTAGSSHHPVPLQYHHFSQDVLTKGQHSKPASFSHSRAASWKEMNTGRPAQRYGVPPVWGHSQQRAKSHTSHFSSCSRQAPSPTSTQVSAPASRGRPSCGSAPRSVGGKPSGFHSSQLGQAFQRRQAPTDFHFVFFKTDQVAVSFPMTFSRFNLHPRLTPQAFSTGISQGKSFYPAAFRENQSSYARRLGLFLVWVFWFCLIIFSYFFNKLVIFIFRFYLG